MSKRGIDAPLAEQMDRLKKTMHNRDRKRDQDREKRLVSKAADDPYTQGNHSRPSTGGVNLGPGAAAQAAVLNAAALAGPVVITCELCQTDFRNEAMLRQHEEGPAHKKAVAREKAEREREAWATNPSAAANALQAAAWLNGGVTAQREPNYKPPAREKAKEFSKKEAVKPAAETPSRALGPSHAQLIAQARKVNEPISINGWIPPSLNLSARPDSSAQTPDEGQDTAKASPTAPSDTAPQQQPVRESCDEGTEQQSRVSHQGSERTSKDAGGDIVSAPEVSALPGCLLAYSSGSSSDDGQESGSEIAEQKPKFESFF